MRRSQDSGASFEQACPHNPFAALMRLAVAVGRRIGQGLARSRRHRVHLALQPYEPRQRRREAVRPPMGRILY